MNNVSEIVLPIRKAPQFESIKEFMIGSMLGDGGFAKVKNSIHIDSGKKYAMKMILISSLGVEDIENIQKEIEIHQSLKSKYIIDLIDYFQEDGYIYMVLEIAKNGNLYDYLNKNLFLDESILKNFWIQTLRSIDYLHSENIFMRDLKPENVLLDINLNIKLCDFGWACRLDDTEYRKLRGGTYIYMSPESLRGEIQGLSSDIWSLGVLLYEIFHNHEPFSIGLTAEEQLNYVLNNEIIYKRGINTEIVDMVRVLLNPDQALRPSTLEILKMDFITKNNDNDLNVNHNNNHGI